MYEYFDLASLPVLDTKRRTLQVSSFDRKYENGDFDNFLYTEEDGTKVLFDEAGAGCIKSIWAAVTYEETEIAFYFGGSEEPTYVSTLKGLFNGEVPELTGTGCTFEERGHWEYADCKCGNCLIQIPYTDGLKITAKGRSDFYYHILYESYCEGEELIGTFDDKNLIAAYEGKREEPEGEKIEETKTLKARGYTDLFHREGAGVIREFTVICDDSVDLSNIYIDAGWDGRRCAQAIAPLSHLFCQPFGFTEVNTGAVCCRRENGKRVMSCYLPMPFWKKAGACFVNWNSEPCDLEVKLIFGENTYDEKTTGYFSCDYREGKTEVYGDWLLGEFRGRGNVIGLVQTCHGGQYCEGNEHFYINGAKTPRINGTGTEDIYLACYWPNLKYDSPVAGCLNDVYLANGSTLEGASSDTAGYYRFFHDIPISYENGIRLDIQHGAVNQTYSFYSSLVMSYRRDETTIEITDYINLATESSKALHSYSSEGEEYVLTAKQESDMRPIPETKKGYRTRKGQKTSFKVMIDKDNDGAIVRRLYDQTTTNRGAKVYIDGVYAGIWQCPGENPYFAFADDDFYIPASLTDGKDSLLVEIVSGGIYTDFDYTVYSRKKI